MNIYLTPYNICRSLLALNTILALSINSNYVLFGNIISTGVFYEEFGFFYLLSNQPLLAKIIAIFILIIVMVGFYPRLTCIPHFYISYSFVMSTDVNFGADRIASNILFLIIPLCLFDRRRNHFEFQKNSLLKNQIQWFFYTAVLLQVMLIYFQSFYRKILLTEWRNGTAVFYYITHKEFGLGVYNWLVEFVLKYKFLVYLMTWGALLIELFLSIVIIFKSYISNKKLKLILFLGISFHFILTFVHGLLPFLLVMSGVLSIYLLPLSYQKRVKLLK